MASDRRPVLAALALPRARFGVPAFTETGIAISPSQTGRLYFNEKIDSKHRTRRLHAGLLSGRPAACSE